MREREQTALYLRQVMNEVQGLRSQNALDANLQRNGVMASVVASLAGYAKPEIATYIPEDEPIKEEEPEYEREAEDKSEDYSQIDRVEAEEILTPVQIEPKLTTTTTEFERVKRGKKVDAKTQLIDWMLSQSQSDDENLWYIHRVMKNTLPLADILYEMPEDINVGRAAMIKLFSSIRSGDFDEALEVGMTQYGLPRSRVFVSSRAAINAAPPAAKRGRKSKE